MEVNWKNQWLVITLVLIIQLVEFNYVVDKKWHSRRKLLTNTFHFKILETYIPTFNKHAHLLVKELGKMAGKNQRVSIYPYMTLCALDTIGG